MTRYLPILALAGAMLCLLLSGEALAQGCADALTLFTGRIVPSLAPTLLLCRFALPRLTFPREGWIARSFTALTKLPPSLMGCWCTARLCGNPAGAAALADALGKRTLPPDQLVYCALATSGISPAYLTVTLGTLALGSPLWGWLLLAGQEISLALVCRIVGRHIRIPDDPSPHAAVPPGIGEVFSSTLFTLGQVFCTLLCACCLMKVVQCGLRDAEILLLLQGILEMSSGCAGALALPLPQALTLCAFFSGFSGLAIAMQVFTQLEPYSLPKGRYLVLKAIQGLLCALWIRAMLVIVPLSVPLPAFAGGGHVPIIGVWEILPAVLTVSMGMILSRLRFTDPASGSQRRRQYPGCCECCSPDPPGSPEHTDRHSRALPQRPSGLPAECDPPPHRLPG